MHKAGSCAPLRFTFSPPRLCKTSASAAAFLGLWLLLHTPVLAQTATLSGFVTDGSNGQALELVTVALAGEEGATRGAVTNRDGLYLITQIRPGRYVVRMSFIGYVPFADTLDLAAGESRALNVALVPGETPLEEVVVQAEQEGARITAGQQTIRPADIERIPIPDVSGDLAAYLTTLPGVVTAGDRGGQLFIRGGEPSQNLIRLDGMTLYQPFHMLGYFSAFPSDIISRADVYAGGFGAKYGEHVSSVIDVWTRQPNDQRFAGAVSLSPFVSGARLEGPLVRDRLAVMGSVRRSLVHETGEPLAGEPMPFRFGDAFGKVQADLGQRGRLSVSGLRTYDRGRLAEPTEADSMNREMRWGNRAVGARYLFLPSALPFAADVQVSYADLSTELGPEASPVRSSAMRTFHASFDATFVGERVSMDLGMAYRVLSITSNLGGLYQNVEAEDAELEPFAVYAEPEFRWGALRVRPGLRLQVFNMRASPFIEPRLRVVWTQGIHQISAAAGLYQQEVVGLTDRRDAAGVFTAWSYVPKETPLINDIRGGRAMQAMHALAGYRISPAPWLDLSLEGFFKGVDNLFIAEWTAFPRFTTQLQPAEGRSYGLDARIEVRRPRFYGLVSYGLSSTRYEAKQASIPIWYGTEMMRFRPAHDRRHQVNVIAGISRFGFDLNTRWAFGSGLPFSQAIAFDGYTYIDDLVDVSKMPGNRRVVYERPYTGLLPAYHRLDVSLERTFHVGDVGLTVMGSLMNAYDRRNIFYLDVFTLRRVDQLPLLPSLGMKLTYE